MCDQCHSFVFFPLNGVGGTLLTMTMITARKVAPLFSRAAKDYPGQFVEILTVQREVMMLATSEMRPLIALLCRTSRVIFSPHRYSKCAMLSDSHSLGVPGKHRKSTRKWVTKKSCTCTCQNSQ